MRFHKIEIDDEIWEFLKKKAEPLEDTPNSVLKRVLLGWIPQSKTPSTKPILESVDLNLPMGTPRALSQILEVILEMRQAGSSRTEATKIVANRRGTFPQTIIDKYCRQLGRRAHEMDRLLQEENLVTLRSILKDKFRDHQDTIETFFRKTIKSDSLIHRRYSVESFGTVIRTIPDRNPTMSSVGNLLQDPQKLKWGIGDSSRKLRKPMLEKELKKAIGETLKRDRQEEFQFAGKSQFLFPKSGEKFLCKYSSYRSDQSRWFWGVSKEYWKKWDLNDHLVLIMEDEEGKGFSYLLLESQEASALFKRCSESHGEKKINMRFYRNGGGRKLQEWQEFHIETRIRPVPMVERGVV